MSSLLRNFVLVAVGAENPTSHEVGKGSKHIRAFAAIFEYVVFVLIQKPAREDV